MSNSVCVTLISNIIYVPFTFICIFLSYHNVHETCFTFHSASFQHKITFPRSNAGLCDKRLLAVPLQILKPLTSLLSTHACDHRRARVSSSRSFSQQPTTCSHPSPPKAKGTSPHLHAQTPPRLNQPTIHPLLSHTWPPGASHPSPVATQRGYHTCPERRITDSLPPFHRGCKRMRVDIFLPPSKRNLQCISDAVPDCATKKEEKRQW